MKITVNQLRRIIKEEVKRAKRVNLSEGNPDLEGFIDNNVEAFENARAIENIVQKTLEDLGISTEMADDPTGMELVDTIKEELKGVILRAFQARGM